MQTKLDRLSKKNTAILFALFFIFSIILFLYGIYTSGTNLSFDELYSIAMTDYSYGEIYKITAQDVHPPLFYWLLKAVSSPFNIDSDNLYIYRYFAGLFYVMSLLVCFFPIRRVFGTGIAFTTSILLVFLPISYYIYTYVRMYAIAVPLLLLMFVYISDTYKNNTYHAWIKLFFATLATMYTHYYALVAAFVMIALYGIILIAISRKQYKSHLKRYLILGLALVVCYIPWLIELYNQITHVTANYWITKPSILVLLFSFQYYFSPKHFEEQYIEYFSSSWIIVIICLSLLSIILTIISALSINGKKGDKILGILPLATILGTILIVLLYTYLYNPIFYVRYLSCFVGLFAIGCSIFISFLLKERKKWYRYLVTVFFISLFFLSATCYYIGEKRKAGRESKKETDTAQRIEEFMKGTNNIIYSEEIMAPHLGVLSMYYKQYEYNVINDGVVPPDMLYVPDYNSPFALAPFKLLKSVPSIQIDEYGIYATGFPESVSRILGDEYEVTEHLEGTTLFKFRKKNKIANDSISNIPFQ